MHGWSDYRRYLTANIHVPYARGLSGRYNSLIYYMSMDVRNGRLWHRRGHEP
jgi:hypothetical protein